jgi:hypothetical protein
MMVTTKLKISLAVVALVGIGAIILWQHEQAAGLRREAAGLLGQVEQVTTLSQENQRLSDQLKSATEAAEANSRELSRLRAQIGKLRLLEQENARLKSEHDQSAKAPSTTRPNELPYDGFFGPGSNGRMHDAMRWGYALTAYASEHQGQFPASLQEASSLLGPDDVTPEQKAQTALTVDQFEMLYHGQREDMTNPPPEGAILIREKQAWQTTSGEWARAYIYGNGFGTIHTEPDGNFQRWEGPRTPKPTGQ